jgi:hypothetical protein
LRRTTKKAPGLTSLRLHCLTATVDGHGSRDHSGSAGRAPDAQLELVGLGPGSRTVCLSLWKRSSEVRLLRRPSDRENAHPRIRKDAYANANRIPVELDKAAEDRGRYLHPGLYGKSRSAGIHADKLSTE